MTGPEHYEEAERLVKRGENDDLEPELTALDHQRAQIHATLALADFFRAWTEVQS